MPKHRNPLLGMLLSMLAALMLSVMPLPDELNPWRPEWLMLVLVFWAMHAPNWFGLWLALVVGVLLDVLLATPLGFYGLAMVVVVQLTRATGQWSGVFSVRHTTLLLLALVALSRSIHYLILSLQGLAPSDGSDFFLPVLSSALMWPTVLLLLKRWSQRT